MPQVKALVQSKTFWLAIIQAVIAVVVVFSTAYPSAGFLLLAKSGLDIILRIYTSVPVATVLP